MNEAFVSAVKSMVDVPQDQEEKIRAILKRRTLKKNQVFIAEGEIPTHFGFVVRGLFRYYYCSESGAVSTKGLFPENTFLSSYSAMVQKRPSFFTIEAMEDSVIEIINFKDWQNLYQQHTCWKELLVQILSQAFAKKELREREFLLLDAATRYKLFLKRYPNLEGRVKQHIIASYLGITSVALSRIRKKIGQES